MNMAIYKVEDIQGNSCFVKGKELANDIVDDRDTPFINAEKYRGKVDEPIIKSMSDFMVYFY